MYIISKIIKLIGFSGFYILEVIKSNLIIAYDALTPTHKMKPGILEIPLDLKSDKEILIFSNLMTMTPGTMTIALSEDKTKLFVHAMYIDDPEKLKMEIKEKFEKRIAELFR